MAVSLGASKTLQIAAPNNPIKRLLVNGVSHGLRSFSSLGVPYLNLSTTPAQAHAHSASSHPASHSTQHAYAQQFLASAPVLAGKFSAAAAPKQRTSTATAADATPLPTYACEKSAVDRQFKQQTANGRERAFFVNDVGVVERQNARWHKNLPQVRPFYAVKCNPDATLVRTLASLGTGFDCASGEEMAQCLNIGVTPQDIIFANPIKNAKDLKFAKAAGVKKMTFDNEAELYKIKEYHPEAELVIRLLADDSGSVMKFGTKFGTPFVQVEGLLKTAKALNLKVIGTSFHIGSGCFDPTSYEKAIKLCRTVFDMGEKVGLPKFTFLDLGGGFPGNPVPHERTGDVPAFEEFAHVIRDSCDKYFPKEMGVEIIGEPGRYMATAWSTLFVLVQGKREMPVESAAPGEKLKRKFLYYINDGVYGSFNNIMFDHAHPEPIPAYRFMADKISLDRTRTNVAAQAVNPWINTAIPVASTLAPVLFGLENAPQYASARAFHTTFGRDKDCVGTFFGPTCDSMDVVTTNFPVEELFVGDWLAFPQSGAYTSAAATTFNGMPKATAHYCRSRQVSPKAGEA
jgi:ornithine decarboxylase